MLKTCEGQDSPVLCNSDEGVCCEACDGLCVVGEDDTERPQTPRLPAEEDGYDTCEGVHDYCGVEPSAAAAAAAASTGARSSGGSGGAAAASRSAPSQGGAGGGGYDEYDDYADYDEYDDEDVGVALGSGGEAGTAAGGGGGSSSRSAAAGSSSSDDFSDVGEPGATEVVYVREGVCVRPTEAERISGRLSLIKQHTVLFVSWLPYSHGQLQEDGTFRLPPDSAAAGSGAAGAKATPQVARDRGRYAVHPLPLSEVKAIKRHTPSFGWHYIVVVLTDGLTLPPLYFSTGGVKALFSALKEHAFLVRSADDPNTFLVNDTADPLQRSLTSLELADVLLGAPPPGANATFAPHAAGSQDAAGGGANGACGPGPMPWPAAAGGLGPAHDGVHRSTLRQVLEQFRQLARDTTSSFFGGGDDDDDVPFASDAARLGGGGPLASASHGALAAAATATASEAGGCGGAPSASRSCPSLSGGAAGSANAPGPAGQEGGGSGIGIVATSASSLEERRRSGGEAATNVGVFELIERGSGRDVAAASRQRARPPPLSRDEWAAFLDKDGRLSDEKGFRQRCFYGGVEPGLRRTAWKILLGLFPPSATAQEREAIMAERREEYGRLKSQWMTISEGQASRFAKWRERRTRVDKDVRRTDRSYAFYAGERNPHVKQLRRILLTYCMYNFDLGYCQGMSDLASPILAVMRDEAEAFWCFAALMRRMEPNFHTDQCGMHAQLLALRKLMQVLDPPLYAFLDAKDCLNFFFCYRWMLIHFKREFGFEEVMRLWEALWSRHLSDHFHLYVCAAVLEQHRRSLMATDMDFDGLLKYCIGLSNKLNLDATLRDAEVLCSYAGEVGRECLAGLPPCPGGV